MTDHLRIVEVGPRDGLQNEKTEVSIATRIELVKRLAAAGLQDIEPGAFVSPKWVPQMAGSDEVVKATRGLAPRLWSLVPNLKGYEAAKAAGASHIAVFTAASETFSQKNTNASIAESLARIAEVTSAAKADGLPMRGYISCALGCPFEGQIKPEAVLDVAQQLLDLGCAELSIGDTIGVGTLHTTRALFSLLTKEIPVSKLAAHFHDTYGQALANLTVALELGIRTVDSSVAGLGGCPYAPGATGNVGTEDVLRFAEGQGLTTGINPALLAETGAWISSALSRPNASRAGKAWLAKS